MVLRQMLAAGAIVAAAAVTAGCGTSGTSSKSAASGGSATTVTLMVGGLDKQIYLPAMLAQRLGYYKEQGLNVELSDESAGVEAGQQLLAGKVDGVIRFYGPPVGLDGHRRESQAVL